MLKLLAVMGCFAMLGACGPLPHPFQAETKAANELLVLKDRAGILVAPVAGALPADSEVLAEAMAARLRDLNVPATTRAINGESRFLHGRVAAAKLGTKDKTLVQWELWDLDGRLIGGYAQPLPEPGTTHVAEGEALIAALAAEAAPKIAALVQAPPETEAPIPGHPRARLVVAPLAEGPGDSARSLIPALRAELAAAGLPLAAREGPDDLVVLGDIALEPAPGGQQEVTIAWTLISARDRRELGQVEQSNRVPAGSLDGPWGAVADAVARAAAEGVVELLNRAP